MASRSKLKVLGGDLETDNNGSSEAWMVQWAISDGSKEWYSGEWEDFFEVVDMFLGRYKSTRCYFHNLAYDMSFIRYPLYHFVQDKGYLLQNIVRNRSPIAIEIRVPGEGDMKKWPCFTFADSALKVPGDLRNLAKQTGLPYTKLEGVSDFHAGWSHDGTVDLSDPKEWEYVRQDARIVGEAMNRVHASGRTKLTASGDAFAGLKHAVNRGYNNPCTESRFTRLFRKLPYEQDQWIRNGYMGGVNISTCKGMVTGPISHIDRHSMYPSVMMACDMPYGKAMRENRPPRDDQFGFHRFRAKVKLKNGKIPYLRFKKGAEALMEGIRPSDPIVSTERDHEFTMTQADIDLMERFYDVTYTDHYEWVKFRKVKGKEIFGDFIIPNYKRKMELKGVDPMGYLAAKLNLNSAYGRLGMNPLVEDTTLEYIDGDIKWVSVQRINEDMEAYVPMAAAITSHARYALMDMCDYIGCSKVIHCDTDSVIYRGSIDEARYMDTQTDLYDMDCIPGTDLGYWGDEHPKQPIRRMWEGGSKRYVLQCADDVQTHNDYSMAFAGIPQKVRDGCPIGSWIEILDRPELIAMDGHVVGDPHYQVQSQWLRDELSSYGADPDDVNTMKLASKNVYGGRILSPVTFTINDHLNYRCRRA